MLFSTRKVGGLRFAKLGRIQISVCVTRSAAPMGEPIRLGRFLAAGAVVAGLMFGLPALPSVAAAPSAVPTFTCSTDSECAALPPCALKPGCDGSPASEPFRLVGVGCAGESGPIYRDEEDEFPAGGCARIEPTF